MREDEIRENQAKEYYGFGCVCADKTPCKYHALLQSDPYAVVTLLEAALLKQEPALSVVAE